MHEADQPRWIGIDHVQLAMPVGAEDQARAFYAGMLALTEVPKPEPLRARGGCWFEAGAVKLHLGGEEGFLPARTAHPALLVDDLRALVHAGGLDITWSDELAGVRRGYVDDPFGNRIELIEAP
ncbi:hypothetical protein BH20ACT4_BH20ACT4_08000 [soil metagenome]